MATHPYSNSCSELFEVLSTATADDEVIVDFDETLFLRNSTAEYVSFVKPGLAAALVFRVLSLLRPWCWLTPKNSDLSRDWFQVILLTLLFPWNLLRWKEQARRIAKEHTNTKLAHALVTTQAKVTIATYGYRFIVHPILLEMGVPHSQLVACRFWGAFRDRVKGKVELLGLNSSKNRAGKLIAVTDSDADAPLLDRCDHSYLIQWPEAKSREPFLEVYLPFVYLTKIKWPGEKYLFKNIVGDDLPLYFLAFALTSNEPLWTGLVVSLLVLSFWCIYERCYNENDELGELREKDPKLSSAYFQRICHVSERNAWVWAIALGALGLWVHIGHQTGFLSAEVLKPLFHSIAIWAMVLLVGRLIFRLYNHARKSARPALYPFLQIFRYVGLAALLPISLIGSLALSSQITARSLNYLIYRQSGGKNWPKIPEQIIRLGIFSLLFCAFVPNPLTALLSPISIMLFLWFLLRASKQILFFAKSPSLNSAKSDSSEEESPSPHHLKSQLRIAEQASRDLA